jgi:membrane protease YdiL (CAAX protease family)
MSENVKPKPLWFEYLKRLFKSFSFFYLCCIIPFTFFYGFTSGIYPDFKSHVLAKSGVILFIVMIIAVYFSNILYSLPRKIILPLSRPFFTKNLWKLLGFLVLFWFLGFIAISLGFKTTSYKVALPNAQDIEQFIIFGVIYCFIAPLAEEMLCRGLFFADFSQKFSNLVTIPTTAALFALLHGLDPFKFALMFVAGCLFGYARAITGGLFAPILLHILNNIFAFTLITLSLYGIIK